MVWSNANLSAEEFAPALSGFDDVLERSADHRHALIGRVQARSYLMRHQEGVGLVSIDQTELATAAPKFTMAMTCFVSAAASLRQNRAQVEQVIAKRGTPASARETRQMDRVTRDADNAEEKSALTFRLPIQRWRRRRGR